MASNAQAARTGAPTPARALILTLRKGRGPVTNTIEHGQQDPQKWQLVLDNSERLEARSAANAEDPAVTVSMTPARAFDLSLVLRGYTRLAAVFEEVSQVSSSEDSLSRALLDAARAARVTTAPAAATSTKVTDGNRLRAMELLQGSRSELSHSTLLAVVDSAVRWLDEDMDYNAMDLLSAVDDEVGTAVYFTLIGHAVPSGLVESKAAGMDKDHQ